MEKNRERKWNQRSSGWILKAKCTHAGPNGSECKDLKTNLVDFICFLGNLSEQHTSSLKATICDKSEKFWLNYLHCQSIQRPKSLRKISKT